MDNFSDLVSFYALLWMAAIPVELILWICRKAALRKGKEKFAYRCKRISLICAIIAAAALAFSSVALMCGISEYFSNGH